MIIGDARKEIIKIFMQSAKQKHCGLRDGFKQEYEEAIGLVETCVAFEAFITELLYQAKVWQRREEFSIKYQASFEKYKEGLQEQINALKTELDNYPLPNMAPIFTKNPKPWQLPIKINNPDKLKDIIEVIYRVRSNLVHGSKTLDSPTNKVLIGNSFHLLYKLLDNIFKEEGIL